MRIASGSEGAPQWSRLDWAVLLILLFFGMAMALALGRDYGQSWDEVGTSVYARQTLRAYSGAPPEKYEDLYLYGPAYLAFSEVVGTWISHNLVGWSLADGRHAAYFASFVLAILAVYALARGHVAMGPALVACALMASQPLLFGHAFVNPKDTPFLGLFAAAVAVGTAAARSLPRWPTTGPLQELRESWRRARPRHRMLWLAAVALAIGWVTELLVARAIVLPTVRTLVTQAYNGTAPAPVQLLFAMVASDRWKTPLDAYLLKVDRAYRVGVPVLALTGLAGFLGASSRMGMPQWGSRLRLFGLAGAVAGLATAVRVAGPAAGVLVSLLVGLHLRHRSVALLAVYWAHLAVVAYLAWPHLWAAPVSAFGQALGTMAEFPWNDVVLFRGELLQASELPWYFAAWHYGHQLSLPALVLGAVGGIIGWTRASEATRRHEVGVFWVWLTAPFFSSALLGSTLYDGGRQLLFSIAPLLIMAAIAVHWVFRRTRNLLARAVLVAVALAPGMAAVVSLHPYQYIYYNELGGGVAGSFRGCETDYWATSYREAMRWLALVAPNGAAVGVTGPWETAALYARPDMRVRRWDPEDSSLYDFLVVSTRSNGDLPIRETFPDAVTVHEVIRSGATLTVVLDLRGQRGD